MLKLKTKVLSMLCIMMLFSINYMKNDSIWVFCGHGISDTEGIPAATIGFFTDAGAYNGCITASTDIYNGTQDAAISSLSSSGSC